MSADTPRPFEPAALFWAVIAIVGAILLTRPMHPALSAAAIVLLAFGLFGTSAMTLKRRPKRTVVWLALHEERYPLQAFDSEAEAKAWIEQQEQDYAFSVERLIIRR